MRLVLAVIALACAAPDAAFAAAADKLQAAEAARGREAVRLYTEALDEAGDDAAIKAAALFGRGEVHANAGRCEEALADFTASLALPQDTPQKAIALVSRAEAYGCLERPDDALADYAQSLAVSPEQLGVHTSRAQIYQRQGKTKEALAEFDAELKRYPTYYRALVGRAVLLDLPLPPNPTEGRRRR